MKPVPATRLGVNDHLLSLANGRLLCYSQYGGPTGLATLYFHGGLSSRIDIAFASQAALDAGIRLLSIDRPGIGLSTYQANRRLVDWAEDVDQLMDALQIGRCPLIGWSGGGDLRSRLCSGASKKNSAGLYHRWYVSYRRPRQGF